MLELFSTLVFYGSYLQAIKLFQWYLNNCFVLHANPSTNHRCTWHFQLPSASSWPHLFYFLRKIILWYRHASSILIHMLLARISTGLIDTFCFLCSEISAEQFKYSPTEKTAVVHSFKTVAKASWLVNLMESNEQLCWHVMCICSLQCLAGP